MRKFISLSWIIGLSLLCFSSCNPFKHEHIAGNWQFTQEYHWRNVECTWDKCDIDPGLFEHTDDNNDGVCDVCNYSMKENTNNG